MLFEAFPLALVFLCLVAVPQIQAQTAATDATTIGTTQPPSVSTTPATGGQTTPAAGGAGKEPKPKFDSTTEWRNNLVERVEECINDNTAKPGDDYYQKYYKQTALRYCENVYFNVGNDDQYAKWADYNNEPSVLISSEYYLNYAGKFSNARTWKTKQCGYRKKITTCGWKKP